MTKSWNFQTKWEDSLFLDQSTLRNNPSRPPASKQIELLINGQNTHFYWFNSWICLKKLQDFGDETLLYFFEKTVLFLIVIRKHYYRKFFQVLLEETWRILEIHQLWVFLVQCRAQEVRYKQHGNNSFWLSSQKIKLQDVTQVEIFSGQHFWFLNLLRYSFPYKHTTIVGASDTNLIRPTKSWKALSTFTGGSLALVST